MVINAQIKNNQSQLYLNVLPNATARAFEKCSQIDFIKRDKWYLAGGTALALQTGHRQSVDLDFFIERKTFNEKKIEENMSEYGKWVTNSINKGTVYGEFLGAKISFIAYHFFTPVEPMRKYGSIFLLAPLDIAVMKIIAISQRGRKRDFFDLYWTCQNVCPLSDILFRVNKQYSIAQNITHILKALVYFKDAETDPEPTIFFKVNWKEVKNFFKKEITSITKKLIKLE